MNSILEKFRLKQEKEDYITVITAIDTGVVFRGTNLWILIFAIFVASLGLNVNSTAVIIGAMLISPLMGPIMGIGLGLGISDISLLRKAINNYLVATFVALITSTIFFLVSPLSDAHSEILARTSPNIYDVLIALFGGLAGILAVSSKQKGNVIPGVAIATALMPPLCTAGYGLATFQWSFFFGAFYLFIINTVFIALATFVLVRFLKFPEIDMTSEKIKRRSHRIVWSIVLLTLLPSIYFGYDIVQQDRFQKNANRFIKFEAQFPNDYLLSKNIDAKMKKISLVYGGAEITNEEIAGMKKKLAIYNLKKAELDIRQGFAYLAQNNNIQQTEQFSMLSKALDEKDIQQRKSQHKLDSIANQEKLSIQVYSELKAQYPTLKSALIQPSMNITDSTRTQTFLLVLDLPEKIGEKEREKMESWLKLRLQQKTIKLIIQ